MIFSKFRPSTSLEKWLDFLDFWDFFWDFGDLGKFFETFWIFGNFWSIWIFGISFWIFNLFWIFLGFFDFKVNGVISYFYILSTITRDVGKFSPVNSFILDITDYKKASLQNFQQTLQGGVWKVGQNRVWQGKGKLEPKCEIKIFLLILQRVM